MPLPPDTDRPYLDDDGRLVLRLLEHGWAEDVRLLQEIRRPRGGPAFERTDDGWELRFDLGSVDRLEYRIAIRGRDGNTDVVVDPHNPDRVHNPFGERSVWHRPGYRAPTWTHDEPERRGSRVRVVTRSRVLDREVAVRGWAHPDVGRGERAPLLLVHDGPAYDDEAALGRYLDHLAGDDAVPPFRAVLLAAPDRERLYSAHPRYARALVDELLPSLDPDGRRDLRGPVIGVGASLGALAHLHAAVTHPGNYGGLLLQSGSFFQPAFDGVESGFAWYDRITGFTARLLEHGPSGPPVRTVITCGLGEENLANNRAMADALLAAGWPVTVHDHPDAHNMTSWRDALDPQLRHLLVGTAART